MKNIDYQRNSKKNSIFLTAGWLFADLMLVLSVIFLVSSSKAQSKIFLISDLMTVTPEATIAYESPQEKETVTPTVVVAVDEDPQVGLDTTPVVLIVVVAPAAYLNENAFEVKSIQATLRKRLSNYSDKKAGLVITLGYHSEIGMGMRIARKGNSELNNLFPEIFSNTVMKPFWFSTDEINIAGTIKFEIYFLKD